jgi:hypothetical protein
MQWTYATELLRHALSTSARIFQASTAIASVLDLQRQYQCVNRAIWGRDLVNGNIRLGRPI